MSYVHDAKFRIRYHECGAFGHVHYADYLRYMQQAAIEGSAAVGYSEERYMELGYLWLAYGSSIEYLAPLVKGDEFTVRTWVHDFRRVRSLRRYDFYRDGKLVTRANTDWVLIHSQTMRPVSVPPEMVDAYAQGDPVEPTPRSDPLPSSSEPDEGTFRLRRRVEWRDIDTVGHVNNAVYMHYCEDCGMQLRRERGWPLERLLDEGYALVARRHQIEYKAAAQADDELEIATWVSQVDGNSILRHYVVRRVADGLLLAQVRALYGWIMQETGQLVTIPEAYIDGLALHCTG